MSEISDLEKTECYDLHLQNDAKMVPFAGYSMPLNYELGIRQEHLYCRETVGLFDVSHMGQAELVADSYERAAEALEKLVPSDVVNLKENGLRYSVLMNKSGGIEDDLMITHRVSNDDREVVGLVVNAARKLHDYNIIRAHLPDDVTLNVLEDRSLLAFQGPDSEAIIAFWCADAVDMPYMTEIDTHFFDVPCRVSRCGYTGEDGFELSLPSDQVARVMRMLLSFPDTKLIGLGARDSLRLEAGFCLYGQDLSESVSPVEADLAWVIHKRRREEGGFLGADIVLEQLKNGPQRKRVGLLAQGSTPPARQGAVIFNQNNEEIGAITSGGFGPSVGAPVAMGYVQTDLSKLGTVLQVDVRGKRYDWQVTDLPFVPYKTFKAKQPVQH